MQDIAPNLAGTVLGLTNCVGSVPGFVAPSIAGQITNSNNKDTDKWDLVWMIAVIILAVESVFYIIFASGEPQPWNFPDPELEGKPREKKRDWFSVSSSLFIRPCPKSLRHYVFWGQHRNAGRFFLGFVSLID